MDRGIMNRLVRGAYLPRRFCHSKNRKFCKKLNSLQNIRLSNIIHKIIVTDCIGVVGSVHRIIIINYVDHKLIE